MLSTDGYKFSMAQAGFPLRRETFYLSFRRGGWQYVPFDLAARVRAAAQVEITAAHRDYLRAAGYGLSGGMESAMDATALEVRAVPPRTWVHAREPILSVTGPSFLVSWLEPSLLRLNFSIQLATEIVRAGAAIEPRMLHATCPEHAALMREVIETVGRDVRTLNESIVVDEVGYREAVGTQVDALLHVTGGPERIFEVGMRAATCESQHQACLETLRAKGVLATSNVALAQVLGMKPVGTMGHEHIQRWGDDLSAFRAMRDMRAGAPSYLLDTFDTIVSGIPAAIRVANERPHAFSIRYDSGDKFAQYMHAHGEFERANLQPVHVLEDGLDVEMTARFETLRAFTGVDAARQVYGYGGSLVSRCWRNPLTRDRVAAVYKLSATSGEPRMKFGNARGLGKVSIPGEPVVWRRLRGDGPLSIIGQHHEEVPEDYVRMSSNPDAAEQVRICNVDGVIRGDPRTPYELSPATRQLVRRLEQRTEHASTSR